MNRTSELTVLGHEIETDVPPETELAQWQPPASPSWDRARAYCALIRKSAEAIVRLGMELHALHDQWFSQGARNELRKGGLRSDVRGWQAKVREELGISHVTALNLISRAQAIVGLRQLSAGQAVEWKDVRSMELRRLSPTPEISARARALLAEIEAGGVSPTRAWAGIVGEGVRLAKSGGLGAKAPTDHARNLKSALVKLRTSLRYWKRLDPEERAEIETLWLRVRELLPDTWRE